MVKAVIFDLDGTLLNTLEDLWASTNHALRECLMPERSIDEIRRFVGNGVSVLIRRAVPEWTDEKEYEKCLEIFSKHYLSHMYDHTGPYDGTNEMLVELKKNGVKTAVVSNKLHRAVCGLCEDMFQKGIDAAFGQTCEEDRKPSPVNVFRALEALGAEKEEAVYVGDGETDVLTAKNAGLRFIGVGWGFRSKEELSAAGAEIIVDSPSELAQKILSL